MLALLGMSLRRVIFLPFGPTGLILRKQSLCPQARKRFAEMPEGGPSPTTALGRDFLYPVNADSSHSTQGGRGGSL